MEEAGYCHRLALMNRGKLIALDTPARLREPAGGGRMPLLEVRTADSLRTVKVLQGKPGVIEVGMFGRAVHVTVEDEGRARAAIPQVLAEAGIAMEKIERITPSLEDVFISLVHAEGGAPID